MLWAQYISPHTEQKFCPHQSSSIYTSFSFSSVLQHGYDHVFTRIASLPTDHPLRVEAQGVNVSLFSIAPHGSMNWYDCFSVSPLSTLFFSPFPSPPSPLSLPPPSPSPFSSVFPFYPPCPTQYYSTISEAIASSPRDKHTKIFVHPGVYNESILIDRPVTLVGAG